MDNAYPHRAPSETPPVYAGGFQGSAYPASGSAAGTPQPDHAAARWGPSPGYVGHQAYGYGFPAPSPGGGGFMRAPMPPPYGFDPSVPPPPFDCPPPGHFPGTALPAAVTAYGSLPPPRAGRPCDFPPPVTYGGESRQQEYEDFRESGALFGGEVPPFPGQSHHRRPGAVTETTAAAQPGQEAAAQRRQDEQWLSRFLQRRAAGSASPRAGKRPRPPGGRLRALRETLYGAARLVAALEESCRTLSGSLEDDRAWADSYRVAMDAQGELRDKVRLLTEGDPVTAARAELSRVGRRRARAQRARRLLRLEEERRLERVSEKEAAIDAWRMKRIREVEERKKEQELKLAADSVLCEVRKKQADVKRMQDILRSLEKLRKLRKEAASRKGIVTEQECDEVFGGRLEELRGVMRRRTAVYSAEEKALMVMLEGEQEEERRKERERRAKKERERQLQRRLRVDGMLFGDELPVDPVLQPFREYYTQAQSSLHALIQIRREWDTFVVAADHPDGSAVPQSWVLPDPPSDQDWASALQATAADLD